MQSKQMTKSLKHMLEIQVVEQLRFSSVIFCPLEGVIKLAKQPQTLNITYPPPHNLYFGNLMNSKENKSLFIFPFMRCKGPTPIDVVSCTKKVLCQFQYIVSYKSLQISVLKRSTLLNPFKSPLNKHNKQHLGAKVNMMA